MKGVRDMLLMLCVVVGGVRSALKTMNKLSFQGFRAQLSSHSCLYGVYEYASTCRLCKSALIPTPTLFASLSSHYFAEVHVKLKPFQSYQTVWSDVRGVVSRAHKSKVRKKSAIAKTLLSRCKRVARRPTPDGRTRWNP